METPGKEKDGTTYATPARWLRKTTVIQQLKKEFGNYSKDANSFSTKEILKPTKLYILIISTYENKSRHREEKKREVNKVIDYQQPTNVVLL